MSERLERQIAFLNKADLLKTVTRANVLTDDSRDENSAEHSWHVALFALVFGDRFAPDVLDRALRMILLHDLVEIEAGDHPIHLDHDAAEVARAEMQAAQSIYGLLPPDQRDAFMQLWQEFEAGQTPAAKFAKAVDHLQPIFQALWTRPERADHIEVARNNLATGRAARFAHEWPDMYAAAQHLLAGGGALWDDDLDARLSFLHEIDHLKNVVRATTLTDASRYENSAEHSWHIALYAFVLADQAGADVDIATVIKMLILHDLVEIDAGDNPIFGDLDHAAIAAQEQVAADRIFGMLPKGLSKGLRAIWEAFEAAKSPTAKFAKSLDRFQPPMQNLQSAGGSWVEYNVTPAQIFERVGSKIEIGAPALWRYAERKIAAFFDARGGR